MQSKTISRVIGGFGAAALVALGMATAIPHMGAAQGPGQPPPPGRMGRGPGGPGGPGMGRGGRGGPMGMGLGIDPRDLTDAQREQIKVIHENHASDIRPLMERLQKAREALDNAVLTSVGDIRGLALEVGNAEGELAFQQAQIETEVLGVLTADQKQKMQERRKEMAARRAQMEQRRQPQGSGPGNAK